jgi:hypothetical protein
VGREQDYILKFVTDVGPLPFTDALNTEQYRVKNLTV